MQIEREVGSTSPGPALGLVTGRAGQPLPSTSTRSAVPRICRRRSLSGENAVTCWPPTSRVSAVVDPTGFTPTASGESNQTASPGGELPSDPHGTQRRVMIAGRPTNRVSPETYVAPSRGESTAASLLPQAPRCRAPVKKADVTGDPP